MSSKPKHLPLPVSDPGSLYRSPPWFLLELTRESVRLDTETLYIPTTKNGLPLTLPLVGEALAIARGLSETSKDASPFPGGKGSHWSHYRRAFEYAVSRAEIPDCSFHVLR